MLAESVALRERYLAVFGDDIKKWVPNQPLNLGGYARVTNSFAVYDGNTDKLGLFGDEESKIIVRAYTLAKAHLESISSAEEVTRSYLFQIAGYAVTENPIGKGLQAQLQRNHDRVGPMLQKESGNVLDAGAKAIEVLEKYVKGRPREELRNGWFGSVRKRLSRVK